MVPAYNNFVLIVLLENGINFGCQDSVTGRMAVSVNYKVFLLILEQLNKKNVNLLALYVANG